MGSTAAITWPDDIFLRTQGAGKVSGPGGIFLRAPNKMIEPLLLAPALTPTPLPQERGFKPFSLWEKGGDEGRRCTFSFYYDALSSRINYVD